MGVVGSKSPLERRNTVLRRSQRKSIHGIKAKADKIIKDIKKFKGTEEDSSYVDLKARIETAERELKTQAKNLQPQTRHIHNETVKKTESCHKLLEDRLKENQEKAKEKDAAKEKEAPKEEPKEEEGDDDDVFVQDVTEEERKLEERKTVELTVIQVEPFEMSPQINKRFSAMKIGVPVMPGSMMESLHRKTQDLNTRTEEKVAQIRKEIENVETEISQFVGRKNGKYYNKIKQRLEEYMAVLRNTSSDDEAIMEQVKLCNSYISSCLSFLDERAVDNGDEDDDEEEEYTNDIKAADSETDNNLSPRSMRTTYI